MKIFIESRSIEKERLPPLFFINECRGKIVRETIMKNIIIKESFYDWCINNNRKELLDLWDYSLNLKKPEEVGSHSNLKYYFKCPRGIHESEQKLIYSLISQKHYRCSKCESIGQYIVDNYGEDYLLSKWSDKNTKSPYSISHGSTKKIWIKCNTKDYHPDYLQTVSSFAKGCKCPYCTSKKILPQDSLGSRYPSILSIWSTKNTITPYEVSPSSEQSVYWKCENNKHNDYKRKISNSLMYSFKCPSCARENRKTNLIDLTGKTFGYLKVVSIDREKSINHRIYWKCKCRCGREKSILSEHLRRGLTKSCGCLHREVMNGVDNWDWNNESPVTELNRIRKSKEYSDWRENVLKRDNYTCQCCGNKSNLNAHHLNNFLDFPEERLLVENGITICDKCHLSKYDNSFHNIFGTRHTTKEDFESYMKIVREKGGTNAKKDL